MRRLITDFDGPIIDVSERYYRLQILFGLNTTDQPVAQLDKSKFWQLKRSRVPEKQIGIISGLEKCKRRICPDAAANRAYATLLRIWLPHPWSRSTRKVQQAGVDLAVMTMRRVRELDYAFNRHDLGRFFPKIGVTVFSNDYVKTHDIDDKPLLMERALTELPDSDETWMVGDTEADIITAKITASR